MKYIKYINELFDSEDLMSEFEIPYLSGDLSSDKIVNRWKKLSISSSDPDLSRIVMDVPWLSELKYRRDGNCLSIGFNEIISYDTSSSEEKDSVYYHFLIEIIKFRDEYSINVYARCYGNGIQIYNESIVKKALPYDQMISILKRPALNLLIDFNNYTESMFGKSNFSIKDKKTTIFNANLN